MTNDPAGQLLSLPAPQLAQAQLAGLLWDHWGLTGTLSPLTSERDQNHRLDTPKGSFTLKLSNPAEPADLTEFQTAALVHAATAAPDLPTPRIVPASDGRTIIATPHGALRLMTWCPGLPLARIPASAALAGAIGQSLAQLDGAFAGFTHPAADHVLLWDIRNADQLGPLLPALPDDLRPRAEAVIARFRDHTAPALARLPRQVIHGDFNPHNLLADPALPDRLSGILDFGDMTQSYRICDLAVAGSYLIAPADLLVPLVTGYHAITPLVPDEIAILPDLLAARMVTTLAISAWRAARYPQNTSYILRNAPASRAGLAALETLRSNRLADQLQTACERQDA